MDILADKDYKVGISVKTDAKGAEKDIKSLDKALNGLSTAKNINIKVDTKDALSKISAVKDSVMYLPKQGKINITVNAADALRKINSINNAVNKAKGSYSVKFGADTTSANNKLRTLERNLNKISSAQKKFSVNVTGKESGLENVISRLQQIKTLVNQINRTSVNVRGNVRVPVVSNNGNIRYANNGRSGVNYIGGAALGGNSTSGNRPFVGSNNLSDLSTFDKIAYGINKFAQFSRSPTSGLQAIGNLTADLSKVTSTLGIVATSAASVALIFIGWGKAIGSALDALGMVGGALRVILEPRIPV